MENWILKLEIGLELFFTHIALISLTGQTELDVLSEGCFSPFNFWKMILVSISTILAPATDSLTFNK